MSEEDLIKEINDIYNFLTEQEPTPDDEIEARDKLIAKFKSLNSANTNPDLDALIENTLGELEGWDCLDLWFLETSIPKRIKDLLFLATKGDEPEPEPVAEKEESAPAAAPQIDISQIVAQVSDQFKGEIGGLKDQIAQLQNELKKKEVSLSKKPAESKKEAKKITPTRKGKLAPPTIKLPKKPSSIPQMTITLQPKTPAKVIKPAPKTEPEPELVPEPEPEPVKIKPVKAEKPIAIKPISVEKPKITPVVAEKPKITPVSVEKPKISPVSVEKPKISPVSVEKPKITPVSVDKPSIAPVSAEKPKITPVAVEKPSISPVVSEKPAISAVSVEKPKIVPFAAEKPSISPVNIEEIETGAVKSSGTDLFNVFSSVGSADKSSLFPMASGEPEAGKSKKKRGEKKRKRGDRPGGTAAPAAQPSFAEFGSGEPEIAGASDFESAADAMPADKDSLYQDLIALEGRRYSLEKSYKELEKSYQKGSIDDFEYKSKSDELKYNLNEITERINNIRRVISSI